MQFALWKKQNRRERHYLLDVPDEESRVSDARKLFSLTSDSHQRAVMLGSAHSTACYDKMRGHEVREQCPFCGEQIPPVWSISPGIAPPKSCLTAALRSLKMNCKIDLLGPHVGVMPMIEPFFTTWPGSGPLCVRT